MSLGAEDQLHQWLRNRLRRSGFDRIGDDGAILPAGGPWAVTQDHQIEGVHFPPQLDPLVIAQRLLAVNLSDLAAMGAQPVFAFLALSCPAEFDRHRFFSSFLRACQRFDTELAGGDLSSNDRVTASLTLLGRKPSKGRWLQRSNGRSGDVLWVAGELGFSALGRHLLAAGARLAGRRISLPGSIQLTSREQVLARRAVRRHLIPQPQLSMGRWLALRRRAAAIDISDGLALDLHRLCRESELGAQIDATSLSTQSGFPTVCRKLGIDPTETILTGGEDYAILFSLPPRVRPLGRQKCRRVGRLTACPDIDLVSPEGAIPLAVTGWDHFAAVDAAGA